MPEGLSLSRHIGRHRHVLALKRESVLARGCASLRDGVLAHPEDPGKGRTDLTEEVDPLPIGVLRPWVVLKVKSSKQ